MDEEWVPLTLLIVKYPKDDQFGKLLAISSLVPFAIITAFFTLTVIVRDLRVIYFFIGQLLNECLALILKKIVKQPRPTGHEHIYLRIYGKEDHGYGMPSQHSQFQAFFTIYAILYLSTIKTNTKLSRGFFNFLKLFLIFSCSFIVYSRVYLHYHFWSQCLVGCLIGSLWAFVWFKIHEKVMIKYIYEKIMRWRLSKLLCLTYDPNSLISKLK